MILYERDGEDINRGLVGYWKLNDKMVSTSTAIDRANFNDGTITGATNVPGINGLNPDALNFDGSGDEVALGNLGFNFENSSASFWFKPNANVTSTQRIISFEGTVLFLIQLINSNKFGFTIRDSNSNINTSFSANNVYLPNVWTHAVITFDGTTLKSYLNGELIREDSGTVFTGNFIQDSVGAFGIRVGGGEDYNGVLQNMRFYGRCLTDGEVSKLHRLKL